VGDSTNGNTLGAYSFSNLPQNTNVQVIISPIIGTIGSASPLAAAPTGWMNTSPVSTGIFNTGLYSQIKNFGIRQKAKVILAKRITQINGLTINPNDQTNLANVTADTHNHATNWADKYLVGSINGGLVKPGDKIQYTIYFLNHQGTNAINVNICDPILGNQTYVPNTIELQLGNTTTATSLTDILDSDDRANYYPIGAMPIKCNVSASGVNGANNAGIAIGITGIGAIKQPDLPVIPGAIGIGIPIESYGLFRFTTQINY
jgi:uncharacterized repeat protein (TIGR01451 family)